MTLWYEDGRPREHGRRSKRGKSWRVARRIAGGTLACLLLAVTVFVFAPWFTPQRQQIADQLAAWAFDPPAAVAALVARSAMSEAGERIFYASSPSLEATTAFNSQCELHGDDMLTLGCYSNGRIHIFDVTDERLDGVNEVTAAHEMLHAAYSRLGDDEREHVDALVSAELALLPAESELLAALEHYDGYPGMRLDEAHSRLGTQVAELSPALERHYARYFADRAAVVALFAGYHGLLSDLEQQAATLLAQLQSLEAAIDAASQRYESQGAAYSRDVEEFNAAVSSGTLRGGEAQRRYDELNARRDSLEDARRRLNADIDRYNALVAEYEALGAARTDLFGSLDSKQAPAPLPD